MIKTAFWLSWRELVNRKLSLTTGIAMVAIAVALCSSLELISRARETKVAIEIDNIGPALRLIPAGKTANDRARFDLGSNYFSKDDVNKIQHRFKNQIRALDNRLLLKTRMNGTTVPIIGIDPAQVNSPFGIPRNLSDDTVVLGEELGRKLNKKEGDEIFLNGMFFTIAAILPQTASSEDLSLFLSLKRMPSLFGFTDQVTNEIRIYPIPGINLDMIVSKLKADFPKISVINTYRGDVAEHEMNDSLSRNRHVLYYIVAIVIALCIAIWSYLNSNERRLEIATLIAIGGTNMTIMIILICRAVMVGLLGAIIGYLASAMIVILQDFDSGLYVVDSFKLPLTLLGYTILLSIIGAFPVSFVTAFREHVTLLQE